MTLSSVLKPYGTKDTPNNSKAQKTPLSDRISMSQASREILMISLLTSLKGKPLVDLRATNNVLTITRGENYRIGLGSNLNVAWSPDPMIWENIKSELGLKTLEPETIGYSEKMNRFVSGLIQGHEGVLHEAWVNGDSLDMFAKLGISPGWVTINNQVQGRSGKLFLTDDGYSANGESIEQMRNYFATFDFRTEGCTENSVLTVNGKEYQMDANGHFNIPASEPVAWYIKKNGEPNIVMPKEQGEWRRAQTANLLAERESAKASV
ncbi:MAG: hypothetical protein LBG78_08320 [Azoarcus sp.]|nr:hypothetical protein [Azoarcus sp.]